MPRAPTPRPLGEKGGAFSDVGEGDPAEQQQRITALNRERQKAIVSDTDKLLKLANELDAEIRTSTSEALTPAQLRKLAAIEKLARNVKDKMSYSLRGPATILQSPYSVQSP